MARAPFDVYSTRWMLHPVRNRARRGSGVESATPVREMMSFTGMFHRNPPKCPIKCYNALESKGRKILPAGKDRGNTGADPGLCAAGRAAMKGECDDERRKDHAGG